MTAVPAQETAPRALSPITLAIDCSTSVLALALVGPGDAASAVTTLASSAEEVGRQHAALLTVHLTDLFARAGVRRDAVGRVHVGIGPGSYTGVRVAVAAAKGLSRAWGVDVFGVYSLLAQAGDALAVGAEAVVTRDARRGNVYAQPCVRLADEHGAAPQRIVALAPPVKVPLDMVAERFAGLRVVSASRPDAAVLAVSSDMRAPEPLYL